MSAELKPCNPVSTRALVTDALSKREMQVFLALAQGQGVSEISRVIHRAWSTVHSYRERVIRKTGLRSTVEIAVYADRNGLTKIGPLPRIEATTHNQPNKS